nr:hypothetical protein [Tanacetum cinerariifolium]
SGEDDGKSWVRWRVARRVGRNVLQTPQTHTHLTSTTLPYLLHLAIPKVSTGKSKRPNELRVLDDTKDKAKEMKGLDDNG